MCARLAEGRRVRSVHLGSNQILTTAVDYVGNMGAYVFQDDVTIIGCSLHAGFLVQDAHANADGLIHHYLSITRQAAHGLPGELLIQILHKVWTAAIVVGGMDNFMNSLVMYPGGYGVEVDEGEGINIQGQGEWVGGGGTIQWYTDGLIYYVER